VARATARVEADSEFRSHCLVAFKVDLLRVLRAWQAGYGDCNTAHHHHSHVPKTAMQRVAIATSATQPRAIT
jgi:hypothetical protein